MLSNIEPIGVVSNLLYVSNLSVKIEQNLLDIKKKYFSFYN